MQASKENIQKAELFLKGLANKHRLAILCHLEEGELCVSDIQAKTGLPQTSVSQHLLKLKKEGIVDFRREHRTLTYFICDKKAKKIMEIVHAGFCKNKADNSERNKE